MSSWCVGFSTELLRCFSSCTSFQMRCNINMSIPLVKYSISSASEWLRVPPAKSPPGTSPAAPQSCTSKLCSCLSTPRHCCSAKSSTPPISPANIPPNAPFSAMSTPYLWCSGLSCLKLPMTLSFLGTGFLHQSNSLPKHLSKYRWSSCIDSFGLFYTALYNPLM